MKLTLRMLLGLSMIWTAGHAQTITNPSSDPNYDIRKNAQIGNRANATTIGVNQDQKKPVTSTPGINAVSCYTPPDQTYTSFPGNDDGSIGPFALPFSFNLYGTMYNQVWINNNGNLTFTQDYFAYSPTGFPFGLAMVAPFWGDVDTRTGPLTQYKINPTHMIVTWPGVGYFATHLNLVNTFQVIITNGLDPIIGIGNNVAFYYGDMQWTTGDASGGSGGFGGFPATVGINKGNNIDYVQVGRFDMPGTTYDGGGGNSDGVDYLDNKCFTFNVSNIQNQPPSVSGVPAQNIFEVPCGETRTLTLQFLPPEVNQLVSTLINTGGLCNTTTNIVDGAVSTASVTITGSACNQGVHPIVFTATDNFQPAGVTTVTILVNVTGACCNIALTSTSQNVLCKGASTGSIDLTVTGAVGQVTYLWSNGATTEDISGLPAGVYTVVVTDANQCSQTLTVNITEPIEWCLHCDGATVVVDQNVTINLNGSNPATYYSGDIDLQPYFTYDKSGPTADTWKAIFNLGTHKLLVKNGATITVTNVPNTSNNQRAPGIVINDSCDVEIEAGGHIIVNSINQKAGDIELNVSGNVIINGEIRNEVSGTNGLPGAITVTSRCGMITVGGEVFDLGVDPGGNTITLQTCSSPCSDGDIFISGLVKAYAHAHAGDPTLNRPTIKVLSMRGAVSVLANTTEPLYDEFNINGTKYDLWGGLLAWVRDNTNPGKVEVQARRNVTVKGHGDDPTAPVRKSFGAIAAIATMSSAPGGLVDVRSLTGDIIANDRAFDVSGRNRLATNFAHINLEAAVNISISRTGGVSANPVVDASSPSVGDKGGKNDLRAYQGNISIGNGALVSAAVPLGSGSVQGSNNLVSCLGVNNLGTINPADLNPGDNSGVCSPANPFGFIPNPCEIIPTRVIRNPDVSEMISPEKTALVQVYPNPFSTMATIHYSLEKGNTVQLKVFSITGKLVATLVNENKEPGQYSIQWNAAGLPGGVYVVQLKTGNFTGISKLVLMK